MEDGPALLWLLLIGIFMSYFIPKVWPIPQVAHSLPLVRMWHVILAFGVYLVIPPLLFPLFANQFHLHLSTTAITLLWITSALTLLTMIQLGKEGVKKIFYNSSEPSSKLLGLFILKGLTFWLIAYPWVLLCSGILTFIITYFIPDVEVKQNSVEFLISTLTSPLLFSSTALAIVVVVPCVEEYLFRGLLQNWLTLRLGSKVGLILASALFALFHFAKDQGWGNIPIVLSLFLFSLFLGRLYQKVGSLWSNIALHAAFNGMTLIMVM